MAGHNADRMNTADDQPIVPDEPDGSGLSRRQVLTGAGTAGLLATVPVLRSMQRAAASRTPTGDGTPEQIHLGPVDRLDRRADTRDRLLLLEDRQRLRPRYPRELAAAVRQIPGGPGAQRARPRLRTVLPGPRLRPHGRQGRRHRRAGRYDPPGRRWRARCLPGVARYFRKSGTSSSSSSSNTTERRRVVAASNMRAAAPGSARGRGVAAAAAEAALSAESWLLDLAADAAGHSVLAAGSAGVSAASAGPGFAADDAVTFTSGVASDMVTAGNCSARDPAVAWPATAPPATLWPTAPWSRPASPFATGNVAAPAAIVGLVASGPRRARPGPTGRDRIVPASMTVTRTSSPSASSITAPKMMLASGAAELATS